MGLSVPVLVLAGLVLTPLFPVPPMDPPSWEDNGARYDEYFPYYLEYAAMTRIHQRGRKPGGRHGHAAFYLKGVQRRTGIRYPQLELVPAGTDLTDPNAGVGVSVNKMFKNVNWVAFDGMDLFYAGGMDDGVVIDVNVRDVVIDRVLRTGAFEGVEIRDAVLVEKPYGMRTDRYIGEKSIGTDFALRFGRDLACVRIPLTREVMGEIVGYLNSMNAVYAEDPGRDFVWSGMENNCTHLAVNALAEISGVTPLQTDTGRVRRLFNLAIPANVFVNLALDGNEPPDPRAILDDPNARASLLEHGWMLQQPGTLVRFCPRFRENNHLWEGDFDMYTMERPVLPFIAIPFMQVIPIGSRWVWPPFYRFEQKAYRRLFSEPVITDLEENLRHFRSVYRDESERVVFEQTGNDSSDFWNKYSDYIQKQLQFLEKIPLED